MRRAILSAFIVLGLLGSAFTLNRLSEIRPDAALQEVLFLPSAKVLKRLSLGYSGLMADIYWTRAVQYFGRKHFRQAEQYQLLFPLLDITTQLDPHLIVAYEFGSIFLAQKPPEGAGQPDKAAELVERGIRENPDKWRLFISLGYIHYMERKDYAAAADAFERGSKVPGALPWMKAMAALMAQGAGDRRTAIFLWQRLYEGSQDKLLRANAEKRLASLKVDEDISQVQKLQEDYTRRTGHPATTWPELIAVEGLRGIPTDPTGKPYKLTNDGRFEVQRPEAFPFITLGLPGGAPVRKFIISPKIKQ